MNPAASGNGGGGPPRGPCPTCKKMSRPRPMLGSYVPYGTKPRCRSRWGKGLTDSGHRFHEAVSEAGALIPPMIFHSLPFFRQTWM